VARDIEGNLYGTTYGGGFSGVGVVFRSMSALAWSQQLTLELLADLWTLADIAVRMFPDEAGSCQVVVKLVLAESW